MKTSPYKLPGVPRSPCLCASARALHTSRPVKPHRTSVRSSKFSAEFLSVVEQVTVSHQPCLQAFTLQTLPRTGRLMQPTQYFLCDPSHLEGLQTKFLINISNIMFHKVKGSPRRWWREIPGWQLCSCPDQNRTGDSSKMMKLMEYLLGLNVLRGPWHLQWRVWRWIDGRYVELSRWTKSTIIHSKENRNRKDLSSFHTSILSFGLC